MFRPGYSKHEPSTDKWQKTLQKQEANLKKLLGPDNCVMVDNLIQEYPKDAFLHSLVLAIDDTMRSELTFSTSALSFEQRENWLSFHLTKCFCL